MKWYRPQKLIENEIQKPIQAVAVIAIVALALAAMAFFIALGKESNASPV